MRIFAVLSDVRKNREEAHIVMENKYDFNAYDTVVALVLTRYLMITGRSKIELGAVFGDGTVDGLALADLLDRATVWAKEGMKSRGESLTDNMATEIGKALEGFSGKRYVQSMETGFAEFLDDFYHDRIK